MEVSLQHGQVGVQVTYMLILDKMDFKIFDQLSKIGVRQNVNLTNNVNYLRYVVLILRLLLQSHATTTNLTFFKGQNP